MSLPFKTPSKRRSQEPKVAKVEQNAASEQVEFQKKILTMTIQKGLDFFLKNEMKLQDWLNQVENASCQFCENTNRYAEIAEMVDNDKTDEFYSEDESSSEDKDDSDEMKD